MKKKIIVICAALALIVALVVLLFSCGNSNNEPDNGAITTETPEPTPMETPESTPTETTQYTPTVAPSPEPIDPNPSVDDITSFLNNSLGGTASRLTEMDRYEDGVLLYAFLIDYSNVSMESYLYVWVNPNTGEPTAFEESSLYAKVPNILFPIPMRNGEIIPYDWFWIPQYGIVMTQYGFFDMSVMEIYKEQLRDAGFSQGSPEEDAAVSLESVWLYNVLDESPYGYYDSFDQLFVHIHSYADGEGFSITMFR